MFSYICSFTLPDQKQSFLWKFPRGETPIFSIFAILKAGKRLPECKFQSSSDSQVFQHVFN